MKMTNEIRIKMAEAEGYYKKYASARFGGELEYWHTSDHRVMREDTIPTYDNDNDLCRFIRGMHLEYQIAYEHEIIGITATVGMLWCEATEEQKQEAIVKVKGWEVPV